MCLHIQIHRYNVPVEYIEMAKGNSFRRQLLSFWMCIKFKSGDSTYRPTIDGIMKDFGCGHKTAKNLYDHVTAVGKNSKLFTYNPKTNLLVARSWKLCPNTKNVRFSQGGVAKMKYCAKLVPPRHITINNTITAMRCALLKVAIDEKKRTDMFLSGSESFSSCLDRSLALNQKKMGRIINAHRTTAGRYLKLMESNREIEVSSKPLQPVYDVEHEEWLICADTINKYGIDKRNLIIIGRIGYVRDANEYFPKERTSFNVIFNAHNRIENGVSTVFKTKQVKHIPHDHADVFYY